MRNRTPKSVELNINLHISSPLLLNFNDNSFANVTPDPSHPVATTSTTPNNSLGHLDKISEQSWLSMQLNHFLNDDALYRVFELFPDCKTNICDPTSFK